MCEITGGVEKNNHIFQIISLSRLVWQGNIILTPVFSGSKPQHCSENILVEGQGSGAYDGFCLGVGATICAGGGTKIFWVPTLWQHRAPLKNSFFEKILISFFNFFFAPHPTWTCFVHHINTAKRLHFWVVTNLTESKNYSFA